MKTFYFFLTLLCYTSASEAATVVIDRISFDVFLDREVITEGCEWIDFFTTVTETTYRTDLPTFPSPTRLQQDGEGYVPKPNPCLDEEYGKIFFARLEIDKTREEWCRPPVYQPTLGGAGPVYAWGYRDFVVYEYLDFFVHTNNCDDCHIPTPEPSTIVFFLSAIGWLLCFSALGKSVWGKKR